MQLQNPIMSFGQRELRRRLESAYALGICESKSGSPVSLVESVTGFDAEFANAILKAVRDYGDTNKDKLLKLVDFSHLETDPCERQSQMAQDIVRGLWSSKQEWDPVLETFLGSINKEIYVPFYALLSLIAVHTITLHTEPQPT